MVMSGNLGVRSVRIAAFIVTVLLTASARAAVDAIPGQLERLKEWKQEGLITDPVYNKAAVLNMTISRRFGSNRGALRTRNQRVIDQFVRMAHPTFATLRIADKKVIRLLRSLDNAPAGKNIPAGPLDPAPRVPIIDWTVLKELFDVSNLRTGSYHLSEKNSVPALIFDVRAKFSFTLATASFVARLYDKDNRAIGGVRTVIFDREFFVPESSDTFIFWNRKWPRGGRATAYIPLYKSLNQYHKTAAGDMAPAIVHKITIIQRYGAGGN